MRASKKSRVVACVAGVVGVAALTTGGVALAAVGGVNAPYAQASALINADGSIARSKGVAAVTLPPASGRFCVRLSDPRLDVNELTPVATLTTSGYPGLIYIEPGLNPQCGNRSDTILVVTTNTQNAGGYKPFFLTVP